MLVVAQRRVGAAHCLLDFFDHRLAQEEVDKLGIELSFSPVSDRVRRFIEAARMAVAAAMSDGVEAVGNAHDTRL
jgi:hypothetical protein